MLNAFVLLLILLLCVCEWLCWVLFCCFRGFYNGVVCIMVVTPCLGLCFVCCAVLIASFTVCFGFCLFAYLLAFGCLGLVCLSVAYLVFGLLIGYVCYCGLVLVSCLIVLVCLLKVCYLLFVLVCCLYW